MTPESVLRPADAKSAGPDGGTVAICRRGSRPGRRSSPSSTSPARRRRSSCTATPTTVVRIGDATSAATARSPSFWPSSCSAAGIARPPLRPRPRPARRRGARRAAAEGDGHAREPEGRRSQRRCRRIPRRRSRSLDRFVRNNSWPPRPTGSAGGHHRSGVVRGPARRARPSESAGVVAARDAAQLGDEPARQAAEHGVRADR